MDWLLEENNPSVRYYTLTEILETPENDREVKNAKKAIMQSEPVMKILSKQEQGGFWGKAEQFYVYSKYKGTVWNLILLAQLGADDKDKRIKDTCEFILKHSRERETGGFSIHGTEQKGGRPSAVIPCLTGNMLWCLIKFGYLNDPSIKNGINWICTHQRFDDGDTKPPKDWRYYKLEHCYGRHTCSMGIVKNLKALAEIPAGKRTAAVKRTIEQGSEFLLKHHIYKRSHDLKKVAKNDWTVFGFPSMWKTDALDMLDVLTRLAYKDDRMRDAVELLLSKQDKNGCWKQEKAFKSRFLIKVDPVGSESKWVTLDALRTLKRYCQL